MPPNLFDQWDRYVQVRTSLHREQVSFVFCLCWTQAKGGEKFLQGQSEEDVAAVFSVTESVRSCWSNFNGFGFQAEFEKWLNTLEDWRMQAPAPVNSSLRLDQTFYTLLPRLTQRSLPTRIWERRLKSVLLPDHWGVGLIASVLGFFWRALGRRDPSI